MVKNLDIFTKNIIGLHQRENLFPFVSFPPPYFSQLTPLRTALARLLSS